MTEGPGTRYDNGHHATVPVALSEPVNGIGAVNGNDPHPGEGPVPGPPPDQNEATALTEATAAMVALSLDFPHKAEPSRGLGRWVRVLTGVDEDLLDRVWEERARYTGLGAIVLGTATMAMLSMLDALDQVFGPVWPVLLVVGLFWGAFICGIDRWLISSTHGMHSSLWSGMRIFAPRIVLALLFGVIIATPLVLTVFGSEIVTQAKNDQLAAVTTYESQLTACNPTTGLPPKSRNCNGLHISTNDPAIGTNQTLTLEKNQRRHLVRTIAADNKTIAKDNMVAREECNGVHGTGLSGVVGVGPNCDRDRAQANQFASQSHVSQLESQLAALNQKINSQTLTAGTQGQAYATAVTSGIAKLVAEKKSSEGRIGLLNRIDALGTLAGKNFVIFAAAVLLGLFIVTVDCLPVLSKMMSGRTKYDELVTGRLDTAGKIAAASLKVSERKATSTDEIALEIIERQVRAKLDEIDDASRIEKARRDAELDRRTAELAAEFRKLASEVHA